MSLPEEVLDLTATLGVILPPDSLGRSSLTVDYEQGGIALNDGTQGLQIQDWRIQLVGDEVRVSHEPYADETILFTEAGITELSLSFDQNMNPSIAYVANGRAKLYYYDTALESMTILTLAADVRSPFLTMDDKRGVATELNWNDVLLFYLRSGFLYYRQQRDSFSIERVLHEVPWEKARIRRAGMNDGLRVQVEILVRAL